MCICSLLAFGSLVLTNLPAGDSPKARGTLHAAGGQVGPVWRQCDDVVVVALYTCIYIYIYIYIHII